MARMTPTQIVKERLLACEDVQRCLENSDDGSEIEIYRQYPRSGEIESGAFRWTFGVGDQSLGGSMWTITECAKASSLIFEKKLYNIDVIPNN